MGEAADTFERLSLELFARQYKLIEPYRRLCDSVGITPDSCYDWIDIPLVPAAAFKRYQLSCVPPEKAAAVYYSSGTTRNEASRHYMDADALSLYRDSLRQGFVTAIPDAVGKPIWALMPSPQQMPNSSLSAMLEMLGAETFFWEASHRMLEDLTELEQPIVLFGTAFAFVQLFDAVPDPIMIPSGSIIIETGGLKGRTRDVAREDLYAMFTEHLGVPIDNCYSEYGMSEMATQFYSRGLTEPKRGPHWVRTRIIDPLTGISARQGQRGLLAHYDLANFNSVLAIQTEDAGQAVISPPPPTDKRARTEHRRAVRGFVLLGRALEAELRGCSLIAEELWARQRPQ